MKDIRNIKILEGLEGIRNLLINWEEKTIEFLIESYPKVIEARDQFYEECRIEEAKIREKYGPTWTKERSRAESTMARFLRDKHLGKFTKFQLDLPNWGFVAAKERIINTIKKEAIKKYQDLEARIVKITGPHIIDAVNMSLQYGDINGLVIGEEGTAKVTTIGAAGYNIQIFHLRVLVKKVG